MTTLQMLHKIEEAKVIYDIHYCRAGVGFIFYNPPEGYDQDKDTDIRGWKRHLTVEKYHPTFEAAVRAEFKRL